MGFPLTSEVAINGLNISKDLGFYYACSKRNTEHRPTVRQIREALVCEAE